jgi:2-iminobutanoate/2-iminopropanoate deaminase
MDKSSKVEVIAAPGVPVSHLPFSPALRVGDLVFVSGQASVDVSGTIVTDTFENEFRRSIENVRLVLKGARLDLRHVVQVRSYVDDPADLPAYNTLYREYFSEPFPARTTLLRCLGGVIKYEVDVIAYAGK